MEGKRGFSFLKGIVVGALAGAAAGVLFAPKSGKETREDLKKKAAELKSQASDMYASARAALDRKIDAVRKIGGKIDEGKYKELVSEVVDELKNDKKVTTDAAKSLGQQLHKDWEKLKKALMA